MAAEPTFLDTSFLVAAMIDAHPGHPASLAYLGELVDEGAPLCASLQVCREFMVAITRKPIGGRSYTAEEALMVLEDWVQASVLLAEDSMVAKRWEQLMERYRVLGKQAHDCNIVATMLSHEVKRLVTRIRLTSSATKPKASASSGRRLTERHQPLRPHSATRSASSFP